MTTTTTTTTATDVSLAPTRVALRIKRWLVAAVGMGFLGLTLDVFLEHYFTIHSMRSPQWTPVVFGPLAAAVALITAWRFDATMLRLFSGAAWISIGIGTLGLYYHGWALARNFESFADLVDLQALFAVLPHTPPLGAPGAFVAMGVLGLLVHTCALKLENMLATGAAPRVETRRPAALAYALFGLAFVVLALIPFVPAVLHRLF